MIDFLLISTRSSKKGFVEIYPKFIIMKSSDLMIRGGDFYAVWLEDRGLWSTDEQDVLQLIDRELDAYAEKNKDSIEGIVRVLHMWDAESGMIDNWHKYCQKQMRDSYHMLDEKLIFSNTPVKKEDYASKKLPYPLEEGTIEAYDKIMSTLYFPEERMKLEWAIGAIVSGDSKTLQKFLVLYGAPGTGKSTVLNIIQQLFAGYYSAFDAKTLGSANSSFALEAFKENPLIAIQHDGDLSRLEDNARLNSLVSHEIMTVNEKFKSAYSNRFKCFLFMGTNKPVRITDAKSGILRRLIDVSPSGEKLSQKEYSEATKKIKFELGAIAHHCLQVYKENKTYYDSYIPVNMLSASNDFYNFVMDSYSVFLKEDGTSLKAAWEMYQLYCEEAKVPYPYPQKNFKEELKNYFKEYKERFTLDDGTRVRSYYKGFDIKRFEEGEKEKPVDISETICFDSEVSILDRDCKDLPAQYASSKETPVKKWDEVTTKLSDLDTKKLHYVKLPENHIVIDFDIPDENGKKCLQKNLEAASKWKRTYAELSKSGQGIHLHYIYDGDASALSRVYDDHIEIKVFTGGSSIRRKLTKCNSEEIAHLNSGLPLKGAKKVVSSDSIKSEQKLRELVHRNLKKEIHPATKPSMDFIKKILDDAYASGLKYDISDLKNEVIAFAMGSTNNSSYCLTVANDLKYKSETQDEFFEQGKKKYVFFDVEVFPNLVLVCWKLEGETSPIIRMFNPSPNDIQELLSYQLIGFNNREYDNHILYALLLGWSTKQIYDLSQSLVSNDKIRQRSAKFGKAYGISFTDVYDFCTEKKSLKKWEIALKIPHSELGYRWDQEVPEKLWGKVADYCENDVRATEAVFNARKGDFAARQIQVELVKKMRGINYVSVNDTTNSLSAKIIFGTNRNPQNQFNYRDLSKPVSWTQYDEYRQKFGPDYVFHIFDADGLPTYDIYSEADAKSCTVLPEGWSILPFFPKYRFEGGKSYWVFDKSNIDIPIENLVAERDYTIIGEGGRVYSNPGIYVNVWDGDITSQHPHSAIYECLFGPVYTKIFQEIVEARKAIKHKDFDRAGALLGGVLKPYLTEEQAADLAQALKIVINSIYGLTSAAFKNEFRDIRNVDNIVAKRGALFMTLLKEEVEKKGYTVAHIKTDSIKIPNATEEIKEFVTKFGLEYGYSFETEANFSKFCLINDAVYISKFADGKHAGEWNATGTQFAVPYIFKKLFSKEEITFDDLCETKSTQTSLYLDMNEGMENVEEEELVRDLRLSHRIFSKRELDILDHWSSVSDEELKEMIAKGHRYVFIGKVGLFTPVKKGCGGGLLVREQGEKFNTVTGTKGYRWMESDMVKTLEKEKDIDMSYYDALLNDAVETISKFGDFEWFVSDDPVPDIPAVAPWGAAKNPDDDPPWEVDDFAKR